jgi:alginate O-acetyltransferase complex protein AlgI
MFSVRYPFNFDAPYQALSIIDFWQRWHMSLTRFIMVYIYTPLSTHMARLEMNRGRGSYKKIIQTFSGFCKVVALPMMITMTLAGVWHGYGITFLVFGAVHGVFLTINNFWRTSWKQRVLAMAEWSEPVKVISKIGASVLVLGCVMVGQVFFRADSLAQAATVFRNLLAISRGSTPIEGNFKIVLLVGAILLITPSSQRVLEGISRLRLPFVELSVPAWRPSLAWGAVCFVLLGVGIYGLVTPGGFLYVRF